MDAAKTHPHLPQPSGRGPISKDFCFYCFALSSYHIEEDTCARIRILIEIVGSSESVAKPQQT